MASIASGKNCDVTYKCLWVFVLSFLNRFQISFSTKKHFIVLSHHSSSIVYIKTDDLQVDCCSIILKVNAQFIFLCNTQKLSVTVLLHKNFKKHCEKKSNCVFLQLRWRKLLKVTAFVIFPTSIMVLFETIKDSKVTFWTNCVFL